MKPRTKSLIREYAESIAIALALALVVRTFVVQAFKIPTGSMRPTLLEGDRILVNKFIYRFHPPARGDILVFKYPEDPKRAFIKRLVASPAETLRIEGGQLWINGQLMQEPAVFGQFYYYNRGLFGEVGDEIHVPEDAYFVLGDNSASSRDSRYWGFVPKRNVIGKALVIYWPLHRMSLIR